MTCRINYTILIARCPAVLQPPLLPPARGGAGVPPAATLTGRRVTAAVGRERGGEPHCAGGWGLGRTAGLLVWCGVVWGWCEGRCSHVAEGSLSSASRACLQAAVPSLGGCHAVKMPTSHHHHAAVQEAHAVPDDDQLSVELSETAGQSRVPRFGRGPHWPSYGSVPTVHEMQGELRRGSSCAGCGEVPCMYVAVLAAARFHACPWLCWLRRGSMHGRKREGSNKLAAVVRQLVLAAMGPSGCRTYWAHRNARMVHLLACHAQPGWRLWLPALAEIPRSRSHSVDRMQAYLAQQQEAAPLTPSVDAVAGAAAAAVAEHRGQEVGPGQGAGEAGLPRLLVRGRHTFPAAAERSYQHQTSAPAAFGSAPAAFGSAPADVGSLALAAGRAGSSASSGGRSLASHASTTAAGARRRFTLPAWLQHTFHALQHGEEHAHPDDHIR